MDINAAPEFCHLSLNWVNPGICSILSSYESSVKISVQRAKVCAKQEKKKNESKMKSALQNERFEMLLKR